MRKRVYISADYSPSSGDRNVVDELNRWGNDNLHKVDFVDMAKVVSGSVSSDPDCRVCDLKKEFNQQINASSTVICVIGDKTAMRTAGSSCERLKKEWFECECTPYKHNVNGSTFCKVLKVFSPDPHGDVGCINSYSYLKHEFMQAVRKNKNIIFLYNSMRKEAAWLPEYMSDYEAYAYPFWTTNLIGTKIGNYAYIKQVLGFE